MPRPLGRGLRCAPRHRSAPLGRGFAGRSLGRSLRANVGACAAQPACGRVGAAASLRVQFKY